MKPIAVIIALVIASALGFWAGSFLARWQARVAVASGPYSDDFDPAREELRQAIAKLRAGDTNVIGHLTAADAHIEKAQQWSRRFTKGTDADVR